MSTSLLTQTKWLKTYKAKCRALIPITVKSLPVAILFALRSMAPLSSACLRNTPQNVPESNNKESADSHVM